MGDGAGYIQSDELAVFWTRGAELTARMGLLTHHGAHSVLSARIIHATMIVQIRSLAKQHAVSTAAWEETVAWLQSFRTSVPEVKLALGHASRPFGEQVGQASGEHSNPLSQRSCTSRFDFAEAAWARAMIEVEMKFATMKKDIDSIRQVVLGGHVVQRRYAA